MKTLRQFLIDDDGSGPQNTVANVQGMETEPVIRRRDQVKYFRRNSTMSQYKFKRIKDQHRKTFM